MISHHDQAPRPADPPTVERRVVLTAKQRIGVPLIAAVPLLALLGLFGESSNTASVRSASLEVRASYPTRFRYRQIQALRVDVRNISRVTLDTVMVSVDTAYVSRFSSVRFDPAPTAAYVVPLTHLRPGEHGLVSAELWGEQYGRHRGRITVTAPGDSVAISISTFVFP
ncbi:MAG TPA: hypothetical protein VII52_10875 [Gemmatimonadaceae bacterium]